jgi:hypothetical protein
MFCPNCAEPIAHENIQYCTKCGYEFDGKSTSAGLRQGFILISIGLLLIPVWMFIGAAFPADDKLVESAPSTTWPEMVAWIAMWMLFIAGAVRIGYSVLIERSAKSRSISEDDLRELPSADRFEGVPGRWRSTTRDLGESVVNRPRTSGEL